MLHYRQIELEVSAPSVRRVSAQSRREGGVRKVRGRHSLGLVRADFIEVASQKCKLLGFRTLWLLRQMRTFMFPIVQSKEHLLD